MGNPYGLRPSDPATLTESPRPRDRHRYARRGVAMFTATAAAGYALAALVVACSSSDADPAPQLFDAAPPPPPGPCVLKETAKPFCTPHASADAGTTVVDAAPAEDAGADAGGDGGPPVPPGPLVPDVSDNVCLSVRDLTLECPSYVTAIDVSAGADGATDLLVSQAGLARRVSETSVRASVADGRAHVQRVHVRGDGTAIVTASPLDPFERRDASTRAALGALGVLPTTDGRPAQVALFAPAEEPTRSTVRFGALDPAGGGAVAFGAPYPLPVAVPSRPALFRARSGEGFLLAEPRAGEFQAPTGGPFLLVRGLPDAPRLVTTKAKSGAYAFAVTADPLGEPAGLFKEGERLRLLEGETFEKERWSRELENGVNTPLFDLAYVERDGANVPVVLVRRGDTDATLVRLLHEGVATADGALGDSYSTCSRSTYVGVTCDACPVQERCETGQDVIGMAKLFTRSGRVFVAFLATDVRRTMGYARSVVPVIGVGCACTLEERSKTAIADSLVVVEVVPKAQKEQPPSVVERMRIPISEARKTGFVAIAPRPDGDVDVVLGPRIAGYEVYEAPPKDPTLFRVLRLSASALR